MLLDADEALLHQAPLTMAQCATTDHRFFDRYIFGGWDDAGSCGLLVGMGYYKNMATADGFMVVQRGGEQHNLRFSSPVADALDQAAVGPLDIEIVQPFRKAGLKVQANRSGLECDLLWTTEFGAHFEPPHRAVIDGSLVSDYVRYNQCGRLEGWLRVGGERIDVERWWSFRDHSWGVRPGVGGFEPERGSGLVDHRGARALLLSLFYSTDEHSCHAIRIENAAGETLYQHGTRLVRGGGGAPTSLVDWQHEITFDGDSDKPLKLDYATRWSDGASTRILGEPILEPWVFRGAGYDGGFADGRGLGARRGEVLEHDVYKLPGSGTVEFGGRPVAAGHREQPARLVVDGETVTAYAPVMIYPGFRRRGAKGV